MEPDSVKLVIEPEGLADVLANAATILRHLGKVLADDELTPNTRATLGLAVQACGELTDCVAELHLGADYMAAPPDDDDGDGDDDTHVEEWEPDDSVSLIGPVS